MGGPQSLSHYWPPNVNLISSATVITQFQPSVEADFIDILTDVMITFDGQMGYVPFIVHPFCPEGKALCLSGYIS
jgi:hypothetical protein